MVIQVLQCVLNSGSSTFCYTDPEKACSESQPMNMKSIKTP